MIPGNFSLSQLQHWMQGMLVNPVGPDDPTPEMHSVPVEAVVNDSQRLSADKHLDIYRYSYIARLRSCMQSQFSALCYALGKELFELFADQYLDTYPSETYTLNTLGERFAAFLTATRPDALQDEKESWPDFMIELAGFEYALSVIFDEHNEERNVPATMETPDESLKLTPVFYLFHHQYPICNYYLEFNQKREPELPFPEESFCVVTRQHYKLGLFNIRAAQYYFLESMQRQYSVSAAKTDLITTFGFQPEDFDRIWPEWKNGFIASGFLVLK